MEVWHYEGSMQFGPKRNTTRLSKQLSFIQKLQGSCWVHPLWPSNQEEGIPEGSIFVVTFFSIKINSIIKCLSLGIDSALYIDNLLICYRSKYIHILECQLQWNANKINKWATNNSFKLSNLPLGINSPPSVYTSAHWGKCTTIWSLN